MAAPVQTLHPPGQNVLHSFFEVKSSSFFFVLQHHSPRFSAFFLSFHSQPVSSYKRCVCALRGRVLVIKMLIYYSFSAIIATKWTPCLDPSHRTWYSQCSKIIFLFKSNFVILSTVHFFKQLSLTLTVSGTTWLRKTSRRECIIFYKHGISQKTFTAWLQHHSWAWVKTWRGKKRISKCTLDF